MISRYRVIQARFLDINFMAKGRITAVLLLACSLMISGGLYAQDSDAVMVDVSACIRITSAIGRFACYEELTEEVMRSGIPQNQRRATARSVAPAPAPAPVSAREQETTDVSDFGNRSPSASRPSARLVENEDGDQELFDTIASLQEREPNRWLITLENGQMWYQKNSERFRLKEGMEVRIYPSPFGSSYRLSATEINGFIQVDKVR